MNNKKYFSLLLTFAMLALILSTLPVLAESSLSSKSSLGGFRGEQRRPEINNNIKQEIKAIIQPEAVGKVTLINGKILTIEGIIRTTKDTKSTYTVDATNAKIVKGGKSANFSDITIGDSIQVQGKITGTNIVATVIKVGNGEQDKNDPNRMRPAVVGKVSDLNGNTITVVSKQGFNKKSSAADITYTIDTTNAKILRGESTISVSDIAVDDTIIVEGTVTGTNVAATLIRDGKIGSGNDQALLQIKGNGQPVVIGKITSITGSTFSIANNSGVTYTIDATNAKFFVKGAQTATISNLAIDDNVVVQGTVNGSSVVASTVVDQKEKASNSSRSEAQKGENDNTRKGFFGGMMNNVGGFFKHLFGF